MRDDQTISNGWKEIKKASKTKRDSKYQQSEMQSIFWHKAVTKRSGRSAKKETIAFKKTYIYICVRVHVCAYEYFLFADKVSFFRHFSLT